MSPVLIDLIDLYIATIVVVSIFVPSIITSDKIMTQTPFGHVLLLQRAVRIDTPADDHDDCSMETMTMFDSRHRRWALGGRQHGRFLGFAVFDRQCRADTDGDCEVVIVISWSERPARRTPALSSSTRAIVQANGRLGVSLGAAQPCAAYIAFSAVSRLQTNGSEG